MPDKKATYRINENMLRQTLLGYTVEVDESKCSAIEAEASALRMQKAIALPSAGVLVKFVAVPLVLILSCVLVYANMDAIQEAFTPAAEVKAAPAKKIEVKHAVVKAPVIAAAKVVPPPAENIVVTEKKENIVAEVKAPDSAKKQNNKQALPVVAAPPTDTVSQPKTEELARSNKPDTVSHKSDAPVKKKKKRRRKSSGIDDLKESTLQPNSAEDDVVVPQ
ncbi:MAG: hypothetical protein ACXVPN_08455 [Bacteroidia bacterium]